VSVEFGVLGPVEVRLDGRPVPVPGRRQRALLAALLVRRGAVVSLDRLVDAAFGDHPPEDSRNAVQTYIARLRRALGPAGALVVTQPPGYVLDVPGEAIDAARFADLLRQARQAQAPAAALELLDQALALWRGPAFGEFADTFAGGESHRLDELRLNAAEDRAGVLLRVGRIGDAVAALQNLLSEQPWRERAVSLLVRALAEHGRTADALAVCRRYREGLRDELGLDPPAELRRLEQQVLRGDLGRPAAARPRFHVSPTSFVGRDRELAALADRLGAYRLVTLVGPGGVGKSRLAQQMGLSSDVACWVDLAPVREAETVRQALAAAIGLEIEAGSTLLETVSRWAARATGLVILDNCEHLIGPVAEMAEQLLAVAANLTLLATSRQRLGVPAEHLLVVPPLDVPKPGEHDATQPAVRLFLERASSADSTLTPDPDLVATVGDICRALDGLPLAIELAAARVGTLTVGDLATRLEARFDLLRQVHERGDPRHLSLESVIDWSFGLLSAEEQLMFLRLSIFAAGFDIAAAEAVVTDDGMPADRVADLLARLADRSMLTRPGHAGIGRYRMLDTVRAFAAARLPGDEAARVARQHAAFFVDLAERSEAGIYTADEPAWATSVDSWLDDVRAAWAWARDHREFDLAVRLFAGLHRYAYWRLRADLLAWGAWAVEHVDAHPRLSVGYAGAAHLAWKEGRLAHARELAEAGVAIAGGEQSPQAVPALDASGDIALLSGDLVAAERAYRQVAVLTGADTTAHALALANVALTLTYAGEDALDAANEALRKARACGNPTALAYALWTQGEALADVDPERAAEALDTARDIADRVGNSFVSGIARTASVALRGRHGSPDEALTLFREAIEHWRVAGNRTLMVTALRNLVILFARTGRDEAAAALAATVDHVAPSRSYGIEAQRIAAALSAVQRRLGAAAYRQAHTPKQSLEEAVTDALRVLGDVSAPRCD
jgi:predicted ATPase/DNA-binding SARP family transcriptional activator